MHFYHNGNKYVFNEEESRLAVEACLDTLGNMLVKCRQHGCDTFYIVFLMAMQSICQIQLDEIGDKGIQAMFLRRMRIEKETECSNPVSLEKENPSGDPKRP